MGRRKLLDGIPRDNPTKTDRKIFGALLKKRVKMLMKDKEFLGQIDKEIKIAAKRKGGLNKYADNAHRKAKKEVKSDTPYV